MKMEVQRLFLCGIRATREEQGRKAFFMVRNGRGKKVNNILQSDMDTGSNRKDEKNDSDNISSNSKNNVRNFRTMKMDTELFLQQSQREERI